MSKARGPSRKVDISSEEFFLGLPGDLAGMVRAWLEGEPFRVSRHWEGNTANAYLLEMAHSRQRLVLKVARDGDDLSESIAALENCQAIASEGVVPRLFHADPAALACLVEYIPGLAPPAYLRHRRRPSLAPEIVASLAAYHAGVGQAFGDFHPENVVVRKGGVTLLDPGTPDQHGREEGEPSMVTDLGLFLHAAASNVITYLVRGPISAVRMLSLAVAVTADGCTTSGLNADEVLAVADRHMDDLRHSEWPRDRITALIAARPCLWWMKRRVRNRLAHA